MPSLFSHWVQGDETMNDEIGKNGIELLKVYSPLTYEAVRIEAKQEVFDDLDAEIIRICKAADVPVPPDMWKELKEKHLSPINNKAIPKGKP